MYFIGRIALLVQSLLKVYADLADLTLGRSEEVDIEMFPFMVSIQYMPPGHTCGGSLVTSQWVLTAAHCLLDDRLQLHSTATWKVVAGTSYNGRPGSIISTLFGQQVRKVLSTHPHPNFTYINDTSKPVVCDIGLLRVDRPFHWSSRVQPAAFAPQERIPWTQCESGRWLGTRGYCPGWNSRWKSIPARRNLHARALATINIYACVYGFGKTRKPELIRDWLCVWGNDSGNICKGNSGSPLVTEGKVMGVASFTCARCSADCPSVFSRVDEKFVQRILSAHASIAHSTPPITLAPSILAISLIVVER